MKPQPLLDGYAWEDVNKAGQAAVSHVVVLAERALAGDERARDQLRAEIAEFHAAFVEDGAP